MPTMNHAQTEAIQTADMADLREQETRLNYLILKRLTYAKGPDEFDDALKLVADKLATGTEAKYGGTVTRADVIRDLI